MSRRPLRRVVIALAAVLSLGGCAAGASPSAPGDAAPAAGSASSASASPAPAPSSSAGVAPSPAQATGGPTPTTPPIASPSSAPFTLSSSAFAPGAPIPRTFTCDGADVSPALAWSGTPGGTQALVLLVDDPDAHDFAHWVAYAIPPSLTQLAKGAGSPTTQFMPQGVNDFGRVGYGGPCPPSGTHHYRFTLYALGAGLGLSGTPRAGAVRQALSSARVLATATLTATYTR